MPASYVAPQNSPVPKILFFFFRAGSYVAQNINKSMKRFKEYITEKTWHYQPSSNGEHFYRYEVPELGLRVVITYYEYNDAMTIDFFTEFDDVGLAGLAKGIKILGTVNKLVTAQVMKLMKKHDVEEIESEAEYPELNKLYRKFFPRLAKRVKGTYHFEPLHNIHTIIIKEK